jgi:FeS assembly SUF system protein
VLRLARLANQTNTGRSGAAPAKDLSPEASLEERVVAALRTVLDPEIPVNIYDLGLIYGLDVGADGTVDVRMTLTAPACPVAGIMPGLVESAVRKVDGVNAVSVDLVWDPPWDKGRMSEAARLQLGLL